MARAWVELMKRLGYTDSRRKAAIGVRSSSNLMGVQAPPELLAIHELLRCRAP